MWPAKILCIYFGNKINFWKNTLNRTLRTTTNFHLKTPFNTEQNQIKQSENEKRKTYNQVDKIKSKKRF